MPESISIWGYGFFLFFFFFNKLHKFVIHGRKKQFSLFGRKERKENSILLYLLRGIFEMKQKEKTTHDRQQPEKKRMKNWVHIRVRFIPIRNYIICNILFYLVFHLFIFSSFFCYWNLNFTLVFFNKRKTTQREVLCCTTWSGLLISLPTILFIFSLKIFFFSLFP